jgi:hypothetical protein
MGLEVSGVVKLRRPKNGVLVLIQRAAEPMMETVARAATILLMQTMATADEV